MQADRGREVDVPGAADRPATPASTLSYAVYTPTASPVHRAGQVRQMARARRELLLDSQANQAHLRAVVVFSCIVWSPYVVYP